MQLRNKRVVLTGACGFIGNNFGRMLIDEGVAELLPIDKMDFMSNKNFYSQKRINVMESNICSEQMLEWIPRFKPDVIINMAAESHVDRSINDPMAFVKSNVFGTVNLMNAALKCSSVPLFVQISTDEVYGDVQQGRSKESDPRLTSSPYSASKASAEMFVESYARTFGLRTIITRSSNNYGPYQDTEKFIPKAITNILAGRKVPVYGNGLQQRDWIFVEDNCRGLIKAIESELPVCNVGTGITTSNLLIIGYLAGFFRKELSEVVNYVEDRPGHDKRYVLDALLLRSEGWFPWEDLYSGLEKTVEWYRNQ